MSYNLFLYQGLKKFKGKFFGNDVYYKNCGKKNNIQSTIFVLDL